MNCPKCGKLLNRIKYSIPITYVHSEENPECNISSVMIIYKNY